MSTVDDWWLIEAGEYVLGTLSGSERELFEKVLERDADARTHVQFWENNFAAVEQLIQKNEALAQSGAEIPTHVWDNIVEEITKQNNANRNKTRGFDRSLQSRNTQQASAGKLTQTHANPNNAVESLQRKFDNALSAAGLAIAALLIMGMLFLHRVQVDQADVVNPVATTQPPNDSASDYDVIAVLRDESGADLWAILAETSSGQIRSVALQTPNETTQNSHQLWVVLPDDAGVQSIGLLPYGEGNSRVYVLDEAEQQARLNGGAAFAVSLEPAGGTTTSAPTGDVISVGEYTRINVSDE